MSNSINERAFGLDMATEVSEEPAVLSEDDELGGTASNRTLGKLSIGPLKWLPVFQIPFLCLIIPKLAFLRAEYATTFLHFKPISFWFSGTPFSFWQTVRMLASHMAYTHTRVLFFVKLRLRLLPRLLVPTVVLLKVVASLSVENAESDGSVPLSSPAN